MRGTGPFSSWVYGGVAGSVALAAWGSVLIDLYLGDAPPFARCLAAGPLAALAGFLIFKFLRAVRRHVEAVSAEAHKQREQLEHEIAERRQAEEGIRAQRDWFRVALSSIGDGV